MRLRRRLKNLNEAIAALDETLRKAKNNHLLAFSRLSPTELSFIREEISSCITSRTYYLENYHAIQTERGEISGFYPLWDLQWIIEEAIQRERDLTGQCRVIVLKPRQSGGTEYATGVMAWCTFFTPQAFTLTVAQDPATAAWVQRKLTTAWFHLPWWMQPELQYRSKGEYLEFQRKDDFERYTNPGLGSIYVTTHAERGAGVAIGKSIRFLHGTEVSRWPSGEIWTGDIEPSMNAPDTLAIFESASLDDRGFFKSLYEGAVDDPESGWIPVFLPAYHARKFSLPLKLNQKFTLTDAERATNDRVFREEKFRITDEFWNWRRVKVKASIRDTGGPHAAYAAYPLTAKEAFQSSGVGIFPRHKLDEQEQTHVREPLYVGEILFKGINATPRPLLELVRPPDSAPLTILKRGHVGTNRLWVWEEPDNVQHTYYLAADTSMGTGDGDYSACVVWRAGRGSQPDIQVAEWQGFITPTDWAKTLYALGWWYGKAEIAVELQGEGITTANYLLNDLQYPNLFRPHFEDRPGNKMAVFFHWVTNMKTKPQIVTTMVESLLENLVVIRSQILIDELRKWRTVSVSPSGYNSYAGVGEHDDVSISALIGLHCLRKANPELRAPLDASSSGPSAARGARVGGSVYAIFDEWTRMRGQERDLSRAQDICRKNPGWIIKLILVTHANTAYSIIHHSRGAENQMLRSGIDSKEILPAAVQRWKGAQVEGESDAEGIEELVTGGDWGPSD